MIKGYLPQGLCTAVLDAMPLDFTVIDEKDRIVAWNHHDRRTFKRRESVLGKDVRACHRIESLRLIESILERLKSRAADKVEFRIKSGSGEGEGLREIFVVYWALRDESGRYLGCMETTQVTREGMGHTHRQPHQEQV